MKVLVTGSSGFVGRAVMQALAAGGHEVCGLSRTPGPDALGGDLLDRASLDAAITAFAPEVVFNLAAETDLKGAPKNGYAANTTGVQNLLDAVAVASSVQRVVWASSQLVCKPGYQPSGDTDYCPDGGYGASKVVGEQLVRDQDGGGKAWVIFRSTTIWGPGMSDHYVAVLGMIRRGLYFHVGRRPLMKSYSYIDNLAEQLVTLAVAPAAEVNRRTFYLADSDPIDLRQWANGFGQRFGRSVPTLPTLVARGLAMAGDVLTRLGVRFPLNSQRLANMMTEYVYDVRPIDRIHGRTRIGLDEGIDRTAHWFLEREARAHPVQPAAPEPISP